jgi:predicted dehydrogenase
MYVPTLSPVAHPTRIAVIGCGYWGMNYLRVLRELRDADVVACDSRTGRLEEVARRFPGVALNTDVADVLDDDGIDAVVVSTPAVTHHDLSVLALRAGKHLLVEKPLATSAADASAIVAAARKAGRLLTVNLGSRCNPAFLNARDALAAGEVGQVVAAHVRHGDAISVATKMLGWASRSGPHWFLFPHSIDLVRWLTGAGRATSVYAVETRGVLAARGVDAADTVRAIVQLEGVALSLEVSWIIPDVWPHLIEFELTFEGSAGRLRVDRIKSGFELSSDQAGRHMLARPGLWERFTVPDSYWGILRGTVDAVLDGGPPPVAPEDALHAVEIIEAMDRSIRARSPIELGGVASPGR